MTRAGRLLIPDLLRGAAILCMLVAHAIYLVRVPSAVHPLTDRINNVASPLFAVAMGMGAAIMLQRADSVPKVLSHNTIRSLIIIALGWWMQSWGSWVAIVLCPLGATLLVGTFVILLPRIIMAALVPVTAVIAPLVNSQVAQHFPPMGYNPTGIEQWVAWALFLNPSYRMSNLLPMFLLGAALFSWGWVSRPGRSGGLLIATGAVLNVGASRWLASEQVPVSGSVPDTLADLGLVLVALGLAALVVRSRQGSSALEPLALLGTVALSLYVVQVAIIAVMAGPVGPTPTDGPVGAPVRWLLVAVLVLGLPLAALAWAGRFRYGPVEWVLGQVTGRYRTRDPLVSR